MWYTDYYDRLADWVALRQQCNQQSFEQQMHAVNDWWFRAPIVNRTIRWNESAFWPSPWELLANNGYCELARALGIAYTLCLLPAFSSGTIELADSDQTALVVINGGEHILNWAPRTLLSISTTPIDLSVVVDDRIIRSFSK